MRRSLVRAHAGALVAYAISNDVERALDIVTRFTDDSDNYLLLAGMTTVLAKFSQECIQDNPDFLDRANKWFNELLRQEEMR